MNIPDSSLPRVVIVGGGFGGLKLARSLDSGQFQTVLIDKNNFHAFQPLLYQVATAGLEPGSIAYPFRKIFRDRPNFFFRMAELESVSADRKMITTSIGDIRYDYLVLATGATSSYFGLKNIEEKAMSMKSVSEALDIRSLFLQNLEKALLSSDLQERKELMSIIIVGGGPTGVELAGALAELKKDILPRDYPDLDIREMNIHLVEGNAELLKEMSDRSSQKALEALRGLGVDVWLGERVVDYDGRRILCKSGRELPGAAVIWAAGVKGVIPGGVPAESVKGSRMVIDRYNRVSGMENVFALGDNAVMQTEKYPDGHPMVAQPAMQQGALLAKNLLRLKKGQTLTEFEYKNLGSMATIGRNKALCEFPSFRLYGWLAWITWLLVHMMQLIGFRNKLAVVLNWSQNYLRHARDLRLIIRPFSKPRPGGSAQP